MDLWINRYLIVLIILCNQIMNLLIYNILQLFLWLVNCLLKFFQNPGCLHWKDIAHKVKHGHSVLPGNKLLLNFSVELKNDAFVWD